MFSWRKSVLIIILVATSVAAAPSPKDTRHVRDGSLDNPSFANHAPVWNEGAASEPLIAIEGETPQYEWDLPAMTTLKEELIAPDSGKPRRFQELMRIFIGTPQPPKSGVQPARPTNEFLRTRRRIGRR